MRLSHHETEDWLKKLSSDPSALADAMYTLMQFYYIGSDGIFDSDKEVTGGDLVDAFAEAARENFLLPVEDELVTSIRLSSSPSAKTANVIVNIAVLPTTDDSSLVGNYEYNVAVKLGTVFDKAALERTEKLVTDQFYKAFPDAKGMAISVDSKVPSELIFQAD